MTITGHRTRAVFDRYHIISTRDLADATAGLEQFKHKVEHNQEETSDNQKVEVVN